jgi:hypothetical protein
MDRNNTKGRAIMEKTITINDQLVELGTLVDNMDTAPQRVGARLIEEFFNTYSDANQPDAETTANLLYFLTDIQVRDYALGLLNPVDPVSYVSGLNFLVEAAPTDTAYINAPAALLAVMMYELDDTASALTVLSNAAEEYSLAQLLNRVFNASWPKESFQQMRKELHPKVAEGIFGEEA